MREAARVLIFNENAASTDDFAPRRLAVLLGDILDGRYPVAPIDCGV
jgi:hypothetical protein